jgi:hypothetical protein
MEDTVIEAAFDILIPVMEAAMILGGHYAKACGRDTVTGMDLSYGMMYAARNVTGRQIGSLFPEIYDSGSENEQVDEAEAEDEQAIEVDEAEEPFTRYEGTEELFVNMNTCADTWDSWEPSSPIETSIKNAVDKAKESV